ncbi:MAG: phosphatase PAP2 family protein [Methylobacterium sp.]|nr:phosphatase PAP2 family protein [Methylobacterium sp.]MCA3608632.1 phosphatase PAP2 family protein [Methylobacterium sp.]MCA3621286.1 phosphatase PAP2 family protein [Methylobacterium sp.]
MVAIDHSRESLTGNPVVATPQKRLVIFTFVLGVATILATFLWNSLHKTDWIGQLLGWNGVLAVGMVNLFFLALVVIYSTVRRDPLIVRSVVACLILPSYAAAVNILTFHAASLEMPLMDATFARWDAALGLDWPAFARWNAEQHVIRTYGIYIYAYWYFLAPLLLIVHSMMRKDLARLERIVGFIVVSGVLTVAIGSLMPAASVFAHHGISDEFARYLNSAVDANYAKVYAAMRNSEPISLMDVAHGTVTFPSHHTLIGVAAILFSMHSLRFALLMVPPSLAMIFLTPTMGGHYFVDLIAGAALAILCFIGINRLARAG